MSLLAGVIYSGIGTAYKVLAHARQQAGQTHTHELETALSYYLKDLDLARRGGEASGEGKAGEGKALGNIGRILKVLGRYEEAMDMQQQSLAHATTHATTHKDAAAQARARHDMSSVRNALFHKEKLPIGSLVTVKGLRGKPPLNGQTGTIQSYFSDAGRFAVRCIGDAVRGGHSNVEMVSLKPENLCLCHSSAWNHLGGNSNSSVGGGQGGREGVAGGGVPAPDADFDAQRQGASK
jgi:hypothetical protein